ncbi:macro domain-containing protein [Skermanella rosea]|uniref:macro domain-containing protein n=1 Tax=Skermanella rosea TaxID=1817965 RepID=UPI001E41B832|nr:macro domain-containing protein [Skermanella rosea]UEM03893.1 macro domain-containing protein [Skermanella rosea]
MTGSRAIDRVTVLRGDITLCRVDAIVNAANGALKRGGGVDGAIHRAAGPDLQRELDGIGGCPTGECRISGAYGLPASRLIHCVGPVWRGGSAGEDEALAGCYRSALLLADRHGLATIAFPAISTGIYGFPPDRAARIAVDTVLETLAGLPGIAEVRFVCFDEATAVLYRGLLGA